MAVSLVSNAETKLVGRAISDRCRELLESFPTSLLQDLAAQWADATARGDEEETSVRLMALRHYRQVRHC